jgi:hypothetical protein
MSTISIATTGGPTAVTACYVQAGLAVTCVPSTVRAHTRWHVTHVPSGLSLGSFQQRQHAKRYQETLLGLGIDFTQEAAALRALPDLHTQLLNALDGIPYR